MNEQTADTLGSLRRDYLQRGRGGRQLDGSECQREQLDGAAHLRVGSLFTGIGGFDLGLERAGHTIVFQCEKDEYRRRVLERHWPGVPCFGDVSEIGSDGSKWRGDSPRRDSYPRWDGQLGGVDLIAGGFPCQDLSVAGKRQGLAGERSGLFFEFARIADALLSDGGWVLIENVPGLLSSNKGRDFAVLLSTLAELGFFDLAWRVLDSRYLGVPQRRRRVFILARRSRGRCASEVLLEPESGGGDFEAGGASGEIAARSVGEGFANPLGAKQGFRQDLDHDTYVTGSPPHPNGNGKTPIVSGWLDRSALDPKPDGPRYAACGDAVTVNVAHWIGLRLARMGQ